MVEDAAALVCVGEVEVSDPEGLRTEPEEGDPEADSGDPEDLHARIQIFNVSELSAIFGWLNDARQRGRGNRQDGGRTGRAS